MQRAIRPVRVCQGGHPLSRPRDRGYASFSYHVIEGLPYVVSVLYDHLPMGKLNRGKERVRPDDIGTRHGAYGVK